ncbi:hypothetical protein HMPREF9440_01384 [Sutterella parvirubra YIT 11816]|uniref:Uncharacterized protein n=1 Tax=Sutterella parvirubra YIT 11816 TaxID=762967 RepID=H3KF67_9BURK|nr:hypothetical protein HMPREF9440_01384 [Sutterella parvirubra YIT 11816]
MGNPPICRNGVGNSSGRPEAVLRRSAGAWESVLGFVLREAGGTAVPNPPVSKS